MGEISLRFLCFVLWLWFNAQPHSKWHLKHPLLQNRQETFSEHCRTFCSLSLLCFLGACCAHLLARPVACNSGVLVCVRVCLMWVDSFQIQIRRYSHRYKGSYRYTGPASLSGVLSATHSKSFRFPGKCFRFSMKKHFDCIHNSFVISPTLSRVLFLSRSRCLFLTVNNAAASQLQLPQGVNCALRQILASCNISINN